MSTWAVESFLGTFHVTPGPIFEVVKSPREFDAELLVKAWTEEYSTNWWIGDLEYIPDKTRAVAERIAAEIGGKASLVEKGPEPPAGVVF